MESSSPRLRLGLPPQQQTGHKRWGLSSKSDSQLAGVSNSVVPDRRRVARGQALADAMLAVSGMGLPKGDSGVSELEMGVEQQDQEQDEVQEQEEQISPLSEENIKVVVRVRPLGRKEEESRGYPLVRVTNGTCVELCPPQGDSEGRNAVQEEQRFTFDHVFDSLSTQESVYKAVFPPAVAKLTSGVNMTIFAYGQTGTGKTWTMFGSELCVDHLGIAPRAIADVLSYVATCTQYDCSLKMSVLEIYNEQLRDLSSDDAGSKRLEIREHPRKGAYVNNLHEVPIASCYDAALVLERALESRVTGSTQMNERSSRSHMVVSLHLTQTNSGDDDGFSRKVSAMHLVDLAGSERSDAFDAPSKIRQKEGSQINRSLSSLGNVINALVAKKPFVPYRDSRLTRLLQSSLGGNSSTIMVATVSSSGAAFGENMSTLRFADRVKQVENEPKVNIDPAHEKLVSLMEEVDKLQRQNLMLQSQVSSLESKLRQPVVNKSRMCAVM